MLGDRKEINTLGTFDDDAQVIDFIESACKRFVYNDATEV